MLTDKENIGQQGPSGKHQESGQAQMLSSGELKMMLGQCLKMASENKITAHNTWGLPLIEHLDDLIQEEGHTGRRTNFQKASVTLDAGVKIYSYRVDSVHTETFKMLGGLGRASGPEEEGQTGELGDGGVGQASPSKRKRRAGELNPESTLESSLESLNVKKFDLAFAVDPLFHKTSAQFDEGGAHGLLLNNLSVYQGCSIVFDSMDVPDRSIDLRQDEVRIDGSSACIRGEVESMAAMLGDVSGARIAPVLDDITNIASMSGDINVPSADQIISRALEAAEASTSTILDAVFRPRDDETHVPENFDIIDSACFDNDDGFVDGDIDYSYESYQNSDDESIGLGEDAIHWLVNAGSDNIGTGKNSAWTGASHWKYRSVPQSKPSGDRNKGSRNVSEPLDFTVLMEIENPKIRLEKSKKKGKRPATGKSPTETKTLLPDDYKYSVDMLGKYSLRSDYISLFRNRNMHGQSYVDADYGAFDIGGENTWDDSVDWGGDHHTDLNLAQASHRVEQVEVSYCKAAKQVDVKALKELMWRGINIVANRREEEGEQRPRHDILFSEVLSTVPEENLAGKIEDLSVHLCFICVLHLANEHGLVIQGAPDLCQLMIGNVPLEMAHTEHTI